MIIGKIVKSNSHTDYICQVYGPGEVPEPPNRQDYAFGTFVRTQLAPGAWLVGVIYNTILDNPEFGRLGPRLSTPGDLAVFSPDYLNEKAVLVGIAALGRMEEPDGSLRDVPCQSAGTDAMVERMTDEQVRAFHLGPGAPSLAYAPLLLSQGGPLAVPLLRSIVARLETMFPDHAELLSVLFDELSWRAHVTPFGGTI